MERLGFGCEFFSGGHTGEETPDPISNSEAKLSRADGTAGPARGRVGCRREVFDTPHFGGAFLFLRSKPKKFGYHGIANGRTAMERKIVPILILPFCAADSIDAMRLSVVVPKAIWRTTTVFSSRFSTLARTLTLPKPSSYSLMSAMPPVGKSG